MCTIITVNTVTADLLDRVRADAIGNPDGIAIVAYFGNGVDSFEVYKTVDTTRAVDYLSSLGTNLVRVWVHLRHGTTSATGVAGCHFWGSGEYLYCHNGILSSAKARQYDVDSQLIGDLLKLGKGSDSLGALLSAMKENFANVFTINTVACDYTVIRQTSGSLFTDNVGNFSTVSFGSITTPVACGATYNYDLPKPVVAPLSIYANEYYSSYFRDYFRDSVVERETAITTDLPRDYGTLNSMELDANELKAVKQDIASLGTSADFVDYAYDYVDNATLARQFRRLCSKKQQKIFDRLANVSSLRGQVA